VFSDIPHHAVKLVLLQILSIHKSIMWFTFCILICWTLSITHTQHYKLYKLTSVANNSIPLMWNDRWHLLHWRYIIYVLLDCVQVSWRILYIFQVSQIWHFAAINTMFT